MRRSSGREGESAGPPRKRDAERTRTALLDAAERVFGEHGYDGASIAAIAAAAGFSRGTPGYFFGSKDELYRAVLERGYGRARAALAPVHERADALGWDRDAQARVVAAHVDFVAREPHFAQFVEWETRKEGAPPTRDDDRLETLLRVVALSWSSVRDVEAVLGSDAQVVDLEARKRHVADVVLSALARAAAA